MFFYTFSFHEDEEDLCRLELRRLLHISTTSRYGLSIVDIPVDRSAFLKQKLEIRLCASSWEELLTAVAGYEAGLRTFKVQYVTTELKLDYGSRLAREREVGRMVSGKFDMSHPEVRYGVTYTAGTWYFGELTEQSGSWLKHENKPRQYSTALGTKLARAVVNIAAPRVEGIRVIDPCCGIGTVLLEALSMGITINGSDLNPLAVVGARENLLYYGYPDCVRIADLCQLEGSYDAAILDLPYNLCSVASHSDLLEMLKALRRIARKAVIVSTEGALIESLLQQADFEIKDGCVVKKGNFQRFVYYCE